MPRDQSGEEHKTLNINREGNESHNDKNGFPVRPALLGTILAVSATISSVLLIADLLAVVRAERLRATRQARRHRQLLDDLLSRPKPIQ